MRIIVHGQQAFGKAVLEALLNRGEEIIAVYCAPEKEGQRADPLKELAESRKLPVYQPSSFRKQEVWEEFAALKPERGYRAVPSNYGILCREATIVTRDSIILVDFIEQRVAEGMPLDEAVVDAGAVRFRPMLLTALAVVVGAAVILADPIFQGLAISLMAGEIASLLISRMAVPILYFMAYRHLAAPVRVSGTETTAVAHS